MRAILTAISSSLTEKPIEVAEYQDRSAKRLEEEALKRSEEAENEKSENTVDRPGPSVERSEVPSEAQNQPATKQDRFGFSLEERSDSSSDEDPKVRNHRRRATAVTTVPTVSYITTIYRSSLLPRRSSRDRSEESDDDRDRYYRVRIPASHPYFNYDPDIMFSDIPDYSDPPSVTESLPPQLLAPPPRRPRKKPSRSPPRNRSAVSLSLEDLSDIPSPRPQRKSVRCRDRSCRPPKCRCNHRTRSTLSPDYLVAPTRKPVKPSLRHSTRYTPPMRPDDDDEETYGNSVEMPPASPVPVNPTRIRIRNHQRTTVSTLPPPTTTNFTSRVWPISPVTEAPAIRDRSALFNLRIRAPSPFVNDDRAYIPEAPATESLPPRQPPRSYQPEAPRPYQPEPPRSYQPEPPRSYQPEPPATHPPRLPPAPTAPPPQPRKPKKKPSKIRNASGPIAEDSAASTPPRALQKATKCNDRICRLPNCRCGSNRTPGKLILNCQFEPLSYPLKNLSDI